MQKYRKEVHEKLFPQLPFCYVATVPYLDFAAFILELNGEQVPVLQDDLYPNEFPCIGLPQKKDNRAHCIATTVTETALATLRTEQVVRIENRIGEEYYYRTKDVIELAGKRWAHFRERKNYFLKHYNFQLVMGVTEKKAAEEFFYLWKSQKKTETSSSKYDEAFFPFCVQNADRLNIKTLTIVSDGQIIGMAMGVHFADGKWVGLQLKTLYAYKGISEFLYWERARLFADYEIFTLGSSCQDPGIKMRKQLLRPDMIMPLYFVVTD